MGRERDIERLGREVHELLEDVWRLPRFSGPRRGFRPQVDCFLTREPDGLTVVVELAGVDPDEVHVDAIQHELRIWGERRRQPTEGRVFQQLEIDYGPFERRIPLAVEVDPARARASYDAGLLTIVLPLAQRRPEPTKVEIEVETR